MKSVLRYGFGIRVYVSGKAMSNDFFHYQCPRRLPLVFTSPGPIASQSHGV